MRSVFSQLAVHGMVPVVTVDAADQTRALGRGLVAGGLPVAEITFRTEAAEAAVAELSRNPEMLVGAGTILTTEQVDRAAAAGARFLVSPRPLAPRGGAGPQP
ncbi:beta/alpha barrel domain-containing protein [Nesterenkonia suensis]